MKKLLAISCALLASTGCSSSDSEVASGSGLEVDRFADIRVLRYEVPGFEDLSLEKKKLAYYLYQAGKVVGMGMSQHYQVNTPIPKGHLLA